MKRFLILLYGVFSYSIFLAWFLYLIGFLGDFVVPKTINSGDALPVIPALLINAALIAIFGLQHTVMARKGFKQWITRHIPQAMERSTYVLVASALFFAIFWFWQPVPLTIWSIENATAQMIIYTLYFAGWGVLLISTYLIDHFELFGLKQVFFNLRNKSITSKNFVTPFFYKLCRHPMMLGILIAVWATPHMTAGHLFFSSLMTLYVMIGIRYEERDLARELGPKYEAYQREMSMVLPLGRKSNVNNKAEAVTR